MPLQFSLHFEEDEIFSFSLKLYSLMEKAGNVNSYSLMDSNVFHPDLGNSSARWHRKCRQPHMHYIGYGISGPKNKIK